MTDQEFADWLGRFPRELSEEEVERRERQHDRERGVYIPHADIVHHAFEESRH
jgi:hypothetical protein